MQHAGPSSRHRQGTVKVLRHRGAGSGTVKVLPTLPLEVLEGISSFLVEEEFSIIMEAQRLHDLFYENSINIYGYNKDMWLALFARVGIV